MFQTFKPRDEDRKRFFLERPEVAHNLKCTECGKAWKEHWATPQNKIPAGACPDERIKVL